MNLKLGSRSVDIQRVWQMMRPDKDITAGERHVLGQLALDREVALVCVGVLEVLLNRQREWKYWTKARECLVVKSLPSKLILGTSCNSGSDQALRTYGSYGPTRNTDRALENLDCI